MLDPSGTVAAAAVNGRPAAERLSREVFGFAPGEGTRAQEVFDRIDPTDSNRMAAEARASKQALSRLDTGAISTCRTARSARS